MTTATPNSPSNNNNNNINNNKNTFFYDTNNNNNNNNEHPLTSSSTSNTNTTTSSPSSSPSYSNIVNTSSSPYHRNHHIPPPSSPPTYYLSYNRSRIKRFASPSPPSRGGVIRRRSNSEDSPFRPRRGSITSTVNNNNNNNVSKITGSRLEMHRTAVHSKFSTKESLFTFQENTNPINSSKPVPNDILSSLKEYNDNRKFFDENETTATHINTNTNTNTNGDENHKTENPSSNSGHIFNDSVLSTNSIPSTKTTPSKTESRSKDSTHSSSSSSSHRRKRRKHSKRKEIGLFWYIMEELNLHNSNNDTNEELTVPVDPHGVYKMFYVPAEFIKVLLFGYLICFYVFLYHLVFLPFRAVFAFIQVLLRRGNTKSTHAVDAWKAVAMSCALAVIIPTCDYSRTYHYVRGESPLKLYVTFNMFEVFDRLLCAFGQDVQDSFYLSQSRGSNTVIKTASKFIFTVAFLSLHTWVLFMQVVSLNVALNSSGKALLTLLVSNNFIELKSTVFKRFTKENLFQITCNDIVEAFQLSLYALILFIQQARTSTIMSLNEFFNLVSILGAECLVDWIKHVFLTKFNQLDVSVYPQYYKRLCEDLLINRDVECYFDSTSIVIRRLGFGVIPVVLLTIRTVVQICFSLVNKVALEHICLIFISGLMCLLLLQVILSIGVVGHAVKYTLDVLETTEQDDAVHNRKQSIQNIGDTEYLDGVYRYALNGKRIP